MRNLITIVVAGALLATLPTASAWNILGQEIPTDPPPTTCNSSLVGTLLCTIDNVKRTAQREADRWGDKVDETRDEIEEWADRYGLDPVKELLCEVYDAPPGAAPPALPTQPRSHCPIH